MEADWLQCHKRSDAEELYKRTGSIEVTMLKAEIGLHRRELMLSLEADSDNLLAYECMLQKVYLFDTKILKWNHWGQFKGWLENDNLFYDSSKKQFITVLNEIVQIYTINKN